MTADLLWRAYEASDRRRRRLEIQVAVRAGSWARMRRRHCNTEEDALKLEKAVDAHDREQTRMLRFAAAAHASDLRRSPEVLP